MELTWGIIHQNIFRQYKIFLYLLYRLFHKTLPISSAFLNWISVRFYGTGCTKIKLRYISLLPEIYISRNMGKDKSDLQKEDFQNADNNKYGEELRKQHLRGGYKVCYLFYFFIVTIIS